MQGLISLYARDCNLGLAEVYDETLDSNGRNPEIDSLSCLQGKRKLSVLDLRSNSQLKWIDYISDLDSDMKTFEIGGCENLVVSAIINIRDIILSSMYRGVPSKYEVYLSTPERADFINKGLNDSSNEFLALKNNQELKALRLDRKFEFIKCKIK